ncbi:hypothetical protein DFH28DRAFT_973091 [Melampsora americana]|nr:hypothetical protein DFH28DRAFT_1005782 [Melampsora americana]KAH9813838.1 hypothetical protein DFH28DRAFT_973091 [Melampsora americana]
MPSLSIFLPLLSIYLYVSISFSSAFNTYLTKCYFMNSLLILTVVNPAVHILYYSVKPILILFLNFTIYS